MENTTLIFSDAGKDLVTVRYSLFNHKSFGMHMHDSLSIGLILDGSALVAIDTKNYCVEKETVVVINPRQLHACNPSADHPWSYYMFYVEESWCRKKIEDICGIKNSEFEITRSVFKDERVSKILKNLYSALQFDCSKMNIEERIYQLLELLLADTSHVKVKDANHYVQRSIAFMEEHVEDQLSLEDTAEAVSLSPYHFLRLFKKSTGISPHKYMTNLKVSRARRCLQSGLNAVDIAYSLGFYDQSHFIRIFKNCTGLTPGAYLRSLQ